MNRIKSWHIFISGFTENRKQSTGLQKCWLQAKTRDSAKEVNNFNTTCFFPVLPWNYDWYTLARFIQINSQKDIDEKNGSPNINIYAYSWGAGHGAIQLTKSLQNVTSYEIQNMVLADPVYCSPFIFMRWQAIFAGRFSLTRLFAPKIIIPSNVTNVYWSRQFNNWPQAHTLHSVPASKTVIHPPNLELNLKHSEMDESVWFQKKTAELTNA